MSARYVYRVYDESGRLIYVGETGNLVQRLEHHHLNTWWSPQIARIRASVYQNRESALAAERAAIRNEDPRWNITGVWRQRRSWTEERYVDYVTAFCNNRYNSVPPRLTEYGRNHIANVQRLFKARFGHDMPYEIPEAVA